MLKDVVEVRAVGDHRLRLSFEDGVEGEIDVATIVSFEGVFAPLRDPKVFAAVEVDRNSEPSAGRTAPTSTRTSSMR